MVGPAVCDVRQEQRSDEEQVVMGWLSVIYCMYESLS